MQNFLKVVRHQLEPSNIQKLHILLKQEVKEAKENISISYCLFGWPSWLIRIFDYTKPPIKFLPIKYMNRLCLDVSGDGVLFNQWSSPRALSSKHGFKGAMKFGTFKAIDFKKNWYVKVPVVPRSLML